MGWSPKNVYQEYEDRILELRRLNKALSEDRENLMRARLEEQKHTLTLYRVGEEEFTEYDEALAAAIMSDDGAMVQTRRVIEMPWQDLIYATKDKLEADQEEHNG